MIKINASIGFLFFTVVNIVFNECFLFQGFRFLTVLASVKHGLREERVGGESHILHFAPGIRFIYLLTPHSVLPGGTYRHILVQSSI